MISMGVGMPVLQTQSNVMLLLTARSKKTLSVHGGDIEQSNRIVIDSFTSSMATRDCVRTFQWHLSGVVLLV